MNYQKEDIISSTKAGVNGSNISYSVGWNIGCVCIGPKAKYIKRLY